ncbi:type II toxin-antitoxin system VapC family toxin [bacterium]|nr:type II toxin-antitoxin system VapC family toxin [bacterium]
MSRCLLDTDWAIDYLAGVPQVVASIQSVDPGSLFISVVSVAELYEGVYRAEETVRELERVRGLLAGLHVLTVDGETARIFGEQRARLRREGRLIDNFDLLIAATCLQHGFRILTGNVSHFERIEGLQIGLSSP